MVTQQLKKPMKNRQAKSTYTNDHQSVKTPTSRLTFTSERVVQPTKEMMRKQFEELTQSERLALFRKVETLNLDMLERDWEFLKKRAIQYKSEHPEYILPWKR